MELSTSSYLYLSSVIFSLGLFGVLSRKNILVLLMSIELMLNAVNLAFVAVGSQLQSLQGQMGVFFIITVAAAESAVGLGLIIALFRNLKSVNTDDIRILKE